MATYRKKPIEIAALQWSGDNLDEIAALIGWHDDLPADVVTSGMSTGGRQPSLFASNDQPPSLVMTTAQGQDVAARPGEWIVPEDQPGRAYPIAPDVFAATYDEVAP